MKLHELGAQRQTEQIAKVFENRLGDRVAFDRLNPRDTLHLLRKVQRLVIEQRSQPSFHKSERNPSYLKLVMLEQALSHRIAEQTVGQINDMDPVVKAAMMKDPQLQNTIKKAAAGTMLSKDEQGKLAGVALMAKEGKRVPKKRVMESELQQAQVVLASQDMLDRVQKMTEDISEMQFKDLPALVDSIKNDMGVEEATTYQAQASAALSTLLSALQQGKTQLDAAQGTITGQAATVPGQEPGMDTDLDIDATADIDGAEGDLDAALDVNADVADEPDQEPKASALGRERR